VWKETNRLYREMIATEGWPTTKGQTVSISAIQHITTQLALSVILSAGFGLPPSWIPTSEAKVKVSADAAQTRSNK
jgi:hypothetical protein